MNRGSAMIQGPAGMQKGHPSECVMVRVSDSCTASPVGAETKKKDTVHQQDAHSLVHCYIPGKAYA
jgi:hypothetical protein